MRYNKTTEDESLSNSPQVKNVSCFFFFLFSFLGAFNRFFLFLTLTGKKNPRK